MRTGSDPRQRQVPPPQNGPGRAGQGSLRSPGSLACLWLPEGLQRLAGGQGETEGENVPLGSFHLAGLPLLDSMPKENGS